MAETAVRCQQRTVISELRSEKTLRNQRLFKQAHSLLLWQALYELLN
jgi:hypothetical protein